MASKKAAVMKVAVLAILLALSATIVSARPDVHVLDLFDLLSARNYVSDNFVRVVYGKNKGNNIACCDKCYCTKSNPPQCRCLDIFPDRARCEGCDICICALSEPPQCTCLDVTNSCSPPCCTDAAANSLLKTKVAPN